ncbi:hypothetical protein GCM10029976_070490 [Kribbella albertanoniae]
MAWAAVLASNWELASTTAVRPDVRRNRRDFTVRDFTGETSRRPDLCEAVLQEAVSCWVPPAATISVLSTP